MAFETAKSMIGEATLRQGLKWVRNNPEKNLVNLAKVGGRLATEPLHKSLPGNEQKCLPTRQQLEATGNKGHQPTGT